MHAFAPPEESTEKRVQEPQGINSTHQGTWSRIPVYHMYYKHYYICWCYDANDRAACTISMDQLLRLTSLWAPIDHCKPAALQSIWQVICFILKLY